MIKMYPKQPRRSRSSFAEGFFAGRISRLDPFARISSYVPFGRRPLDPFSVSDLRFHWLRAENHVLAQLRAGVHPLLIQQYAEELISPDGIGTVYFRSVVRIIGNLVAQGTFVGLLDDGVDLQAYRMMREVEKARFARLMRERFLHVKTLEEWARDEEIEKRIARARSLDRKAEEELRELKEEELKWAEEKYKTTEEALRKALLKQEKSTAAALQNDNRSRRSRTSTSGASIYPGHDGDMPAGYYGAQMADSPRRGRTSTRQRDIPPTPPSKTSNHATFGSGRSPFSRRRDSSVPSTPLPKTFNHATTGHRGRSQKRREEAPPTRPDRYDPPLAPRNRSTSSRQSSRSRLGDWLQNNAAIPIPRSEHFYSDRATAGSNTTTTGSRNRGPPPPSMRGWDRVWNQTPSLFGSQRRSRSHSSTRDATTSSSLFGSQRRREGSCTRQASTERGGRSSSIPYARNVDTPDHPHHTQNPHPNHPNPPNFSRPRSISRDYRIPSQQPSQNFSRPRNHHQANAQHHGIYDPRDRIQTGYAETIRTESTRRGRDGVAHADREIFGMHDPRDRIPTGYVKTIRTESTRREQDGLRHAHRESHGIRDPRDRSHTRFAETVRSFGRSRSVSRGPGLRRRR